VNAFGGVDLEIPNVYYSGPDTDPQVLTLFDMNKDYRFEVEALAEGAFDFEIHQRTYEEYKKIVYDDVPIIQNTKAMLNYSSTTTNYTMDIDTNGDGHIDTTKSPDSVEINHKPVATIISPANGTTFSFGETITFDGTGVDREDGPLPDSSLRWYSDNDGEIGNGSCFNKSDLSGGEHIITLAVNDSGGLIGSDAVIITIEVAPSEVFDTGQGTYPSIFGTHNGTITPNQDITVNTLYTYSCPGTGGHTESIELYENNELIANGTWNGYIGDYHNITIHNLTGGAPYVMLLKNREYRYVIRTGSYPQIIHEQSKEVTGGTITCTRFRDANGRIYNNWIPAIRLE
jgi:hypothetical protein